MITQTAEVIRRWNLALLGKEKFLNHLPLQMQFKISQKYSSLLQLILKLVRTLHYLLTTWIIHFQNSIQEILQINKNKNGFKVLKKTSIDLALKLHSSTFLDSAFIQKQIPTNISLSVLKCLQEWAQATKQWMAKNIKGHHP